MSFADGYLLNYQISNDQFKALKEKISRDYQNFPLSDSWRITIDKNAQVLNLEDKPISGLFAAGEIVGGIFYHNSLRAAGLMHGSVFGKIAGKTAANSI